MTSRAPIRLALALALLAALAVPLLGAMSARAADLPPGDPGTLAPAHLALAAPPIIAAKASVYATATLTDATGTPLPGMAVVIERVGSPATTLAVGVTNAHGQVRARLAPTSRIVLRARFEGDSTYEATMSPRVAIKPRVLLGKPWTHDDFAYPGQSLPARGTLWPAHSSHSTATTVVCQRLESGKWVTRKTYSAKITNTAKGSTYSAMFKLPSTGTWRVRAVHEDSAHAKSWGPTQHISCTKWNERYVGHRIGTFRTTKKWVAITIDDGPNSRTLDVCSILEKYGARGTFFFIGSLLAKNKAQAKKAYDRGHEIGNHTWNHDMLTHGYDAALTTVTKTRNTVKDALGIWSTWVRGMGGSVDSAGLKAVNNSGQLYANWSVTAADTSPRHYTSDQIYRRIVNHTGKGDVILMHQTHPESIAALPRICATLKARGYKMVTLSKLASVSKPW